MRRFSVIALMVSAIVFATSGIASASSHGAMPSTLSLFGILQWELEHYVIHMQLTWEAIRTLIVSPQIGWMLLDNQALCSNMGFLTSHMFETGAHALLSFADSILLAVWVGVEAALVTWRFALRLGFVPASFLLL